MENLNLSKCSPKVLGIFDSLNTTFHPSLKITSAYRSPENEFAHGRAGTSSHCKGLALDVSCTDSVTRLKIVFKLLSLGVKRIGIAKTFIHFDIDPDKPSCMWLY